MTHLVLHIDDNVYRVIALCGGGWRLNRADGRECHDVHVRELDGRVVCTCKDYLYRQGPTAQGRCKHGDAAVYTGLLNPPSPHVETTQDPEDPAKLLVGNLSPDRAPA